MIAGIMVLGALDLDIGPAVAGLGVVGIAVGFGAQSLVRDYLNGALILIENQYSKGDVVSIAGVSGAVEDFSLRRTTLRDLDGVVHTVPNGEVMSPRTGPGRGPGSTRTSRSPSGPTSTRRSRSSRSSARRWPPTRSGSAGSSSRRGSSGSSRSTSAGSPSRSSERSGRPSNGRPAASSASCSSRRSRRTGSACPVRRRSSSPSREATEGVQIGPAPDPGRSRRRVGSVRAAARPAAAA